MDQRQDIRDFLSSRRARITPQQAGLTFYGGNRRVPGLRREEVAMLAGVSIDYYTRPERGNLQGVSDSVLDALANALQLDDAERAHLFDLARSANDNPRRRRQPSAGRIRPSVQRVLDAITTAPAWVHNDRLDFLAAMRSAMPCTRRCSPTPVLRSTAPASSSSTIALSSSTNTGA